MSIPITDKYLLYKPGLGNEADIRVLNANTDKIDNGMYQNRLMIGAGYNPERTSSNPYMKDDLVVKQTTILDENDNPVSYSFQLYKCDYDNTYGAWDASKWHITDIATELGLAGGGGSSTLAGLSDVDISSLQEGDVLTYDGTKWVNGEGTSSPTKEASGNPIELSDAASAPMVKCVSEITGSQDLHGYDKPWVGGAGKNKLKYPYKNTSGTISGIVFTDNGDGTFTANGTATARTIFYIHMADDNFTPPTGQYIFTKGFAYDNDIDVAIILEAYNGISYIKRIAKSAGVDAVTCNIDYDGFDRVEIYLAINEGTTISNLLFKPMLRLATESDPTFSPYSNICPITAYTEGEIEVRGKNIAQSPQQGVYSFSDGTFNPNNTNYAYSKAKVVGNEQYTVSIQNIGQYCGVVYLDDNENFISSVSSITPPQTVTTPSNCRYLIAETGGTDNPITPSTIGKVQIEQGSTATDYEPYVGTTHTTTYPSAIYRGSEDVVNEEVTSEMVVIDLGDLTFALTQDGGFYTDSLRGIIKAVNYSQETTTAICSCYMATTGSNAANRLVDGSFGLDGNGRIYFYDTTKVGKTAAEVKTDLTGQALAYELATPTTSSVTPTNLPIKSLSGYNHIESSTGDMEVEYITEEYQPLVDLIESNKHVYSTAEQIVGTWIDGSAVYEKTLYYSSLSAAHNNWASLETMSIGQLLDVDVSFKDSSGRQLDEQYLRISYYNGSLYYHTPETSSTCTDIYITIQYTKATAQTRSLNLSKGEISVEKKVEEEPIEEETNVENDLDEWLEDSEEVEEEVDEGTDEDSDVEEEEENEATNE